VGQILAKLKQLGLEKRTLVIFTSDHGEMLGDHGLHSKMVLYEGSAHIPLLMRLPGVIDAGAAVVAPVSHVDLFATILDYLKMPSSPSEGRCLRKLIDGDHDDGPDYCVSEWGSRGGPTLMLRTKDWKYITSHAPRSTPVDAPGPPTRAMLSWRGAPPPTAGLAWAASNTAAGCSIWASDFFLPTKSRWCTWT
jgi:arylsulfatase A-like enzyme